MRKHSENEDSSSRNRKSNHKSGWLTGMLHVLDFHQWRTKNRPICWKTPRTHSLIRETDEQEPFLDSKKLSVVVTEDKPKRQETKVMMTTKQVTDYVDILEILRKEELFVKITKDSKSELKKQVQIKSNPKVLPKSCSFPLSSSSLPAKIEHKQRENWYAPKQNVTVLTLNVPSKDTSHEHKPVFPEDHGFNQAVVNRFREIKKLLKSMLKDRKHAKKQSKSLDISKDDYVGRYSKLFEHSFKREGGDLRSRSLKLSYEEKKIDSRDNKLHFFRRISSLSSLEVLGSFLTDLPQESSTRKYVDQDTNLESKNFLSVSESLVKTEKEEEKYEEEKQRSQENHLSNLNHRILQQDQDSVSNICSLDSNICSLDSTAIKTKTLLSQGLGLTSLETQNHEEEIENGYFCYVKKVLEVSGFLENKDNGEKWHSENQPLNPSLLYELKIHGEEGEAMNKELLFDLVNEAIAEIRNQSHIYFHKAFSFGYPNGKCFLDEVWRRVEWSLYELGDENRDRSLDDIVGRDLTKVDGWMNQRGESELITLELEDLIFDEVLDELLFSYS